MKAIRPKWLAIICMAIMPSLIQAQSLNVSTVELPVSKTAQKKGMYVNTSLTKSGNIVSYIAYDLKKGELGFDVIGVDPSGKPLPLSSEIANKASQQKYGIEIPEPGMVKIPGDGLKVVRLASATGALGKLKIEIGQFKPKYATSVEYGEYITTYTPVLRGFKFKDDEVIKSEMRLNIYAAHCDDEDNMEKNYNIIEGLIPNTIGFYRQDAKIAFIGKDARYDKDSPNAQNVVVTGFWDGPSKTFTNIRETVLEYNQGKVADGYDGNGNRSALVSTLNAPSTISAHNKFQAKGKPFMTYLTIDKSADVKENVTFESTSIRGNFGLYGFDDTHFILGSINEKHDGYHRGDVGSPTGFQIVMIRNGKVDKMVVTSMDELEKALVTPGGKKGKLKYKDITFSKCEKAPNGDYLAYAQGATEYLIFQFDGSAKVKALYMIERVPGNGFGIPVLERGNDIYVIYREQSGAITVGVKKSISRGYGYMKNINFSRVDEVMTYGRIVKVNVENRTCSEQYDIIGDVILGEESVFKTDNGALMLPVRDAKKKNYRMVIID